MVTQVGAFQPESVIAEAISRPPIMGVVKVAFVPTKNKLSKEQAPPFSKANKGSFKSWKILILFVPRDAVLNSKTK